MAVLGSEGSPVSAGALPSLVPGSSPLQWTSLLLAARSRLLLRGSPAAGLRAGLGLQLLLISTV